MRPMPMTQFCHRIIINGVTGRRTKLAFLLFDDLMLHPTTVATEETCNRLPTVRLRFAGLALVARPTACCGWI